MLAEAVTGKEWGHIGNVQLWAACLMPSGAVAVPRSRPFLRHSLEEVPGADRDERQRGAGGTPCRAGPQAVGRTPSPAPSHGLGVTWKSPLPTQRLRSGGWWRERTSVPPTCGTCRRGSVSLRVSRDLPFPPCHTPAAVSCPFQVLLRVYPEPPAGLGSVMKVSGAGPAPREPF